MPCISRVSRMLVLLVSATLSVVLAFAGAACGRAIEASSEDAGVAASPDGASPDAASPGASDAGDAGSALAPADASTPDDALDASCGVEPLVLDPDATPGTCEISPADVACDAPSDCTLLVVTYCGCFDDVYGVSTTSTARCTPPPCPPPAPGGCPASGFLAQDCSQATSLSQLSVKCVDHVCRSFIPIEH